MKRKIIKLGQATYVTSLPSKWVRKYNLKQGDYLEVEENENTIQIATEQQLKQRSITIRLPRKELFLKRLIYTPYRFGYDEIKFIYPDPKLIHEIQKAAQILMGFEIVEQGENYCIFRNISASFEEEFDNIVKRTFLVTLNLLRDTLDALQKKEFARFTNIPEIQLVADKLACFCERVLNKRGAANFYKNSQVYLLVWNLRLIGEDLTHRLCPILAKQKSVSPAVVVVFKELVNLFEEFFHLYYKPTLEGSVALKNHHLALRQKSLSLLVKATPDERLIAHFIEMIVERIKDVSLSIQLPEEDLQMKKENSHV